MVSFAKGEKMTTQNQSSRLATGANIVALAGVGLIVYGIMFFIRTFNGFTELGLTPELIGGTPDQIRDFSQNLYNYIIHLQVAISGFLIALGMAVIALAIYGIRRGERWAMWTALLAPVVAVAIGLPLHYPFHFDTFGHLGLIYLDAIILFVGTGISYQALKA